MPILFLVSPLILLLSLTACGGSSDSNKSKNSHPQEQEGVGYFIDSPVQGLTYTSTSYSGTTDELGRYDFAKGEAVTFKLGTITLGSSTSAKAIHVSDLFDDPEADDTETINLARLLLTLDSNADADDGIQLSAAAISEANLINFSNGIDFSSSSFDADVANYISKNGVVAASVTSLVSAQDATEHLAYTIAEVEGLNAGCGIKCVPRAAFKTDIESVTPRHGEANVSPLTQSISIDMDSTYDGALENVYVEIFGLPVTAGYENCRIDWPGFTCDTFTNNTIFDLFDSGTLQILNDVGSEISVSINQTTKVLTVTLITALRSNNQYTVHVFNDGADGDDDNYKTWWQFTTSSAN